MLFGACLPVGAASIDGEWVVYQDRHTPDKGTVVINAAQQILFVPLPADGVKYDGLPESFGISTNSPSNTEANNAQLEASMNAEQLALYRERQRQMDLLGQQHEEWKAQITRQGQYAVPFALYEDDPLRIAPAQENSPPLRITQMHENVLLVRVTSLYSNTFEQRTPTILLRKGAKFTPPKGKPKGRWFYTKSGRWPDQSVLDIVLDMDKATEVAYIISEKPPRKLSTYRCKHMKAQAPYVVQFGSKSIIFGFSWLTKDLLLLNINSKFPTPGTLLLRPYTGK